MQVCTGLARAIAKIRPDPNTTWLTGRWIPAPLTDPLWLLRHRPQLRITSGSNQSKNVANLPGRTCDILTPEVTIVSDARLRQRGAPIAVTLAVVTFSGILADIVSLSQVLTLSGANSLLILYPLGGLGVAIPGMALGPVVDRWARLPMLRTVGLGIAGAYLIALALLPSAPMAAVSLAWIVAVLQNTLFPMLLWSLAADIFNVSESREINGWIGSWSYVGRLAALALSTIAPALAYWAQVPLTALLAIPPVLTAAVAIWLPHRMRDAPAARGTAGATDSLANGWRFVKEVRIWRWLVIGAAFSCTADGLNSIGVAAASEFAFGQNPGALQTYLAGMQLLATLLSLAVQRWLSAPAIRRMGVRGGLLVQPVSQVAAGVLLTASLLTGDLLVLAIAIVVWRVPAWTLDQTAKSAALGYVPDQRRARVSLILVLASIALAWILSAPLAAPALLNGPAWLLGATSAIVASIAFVWWRKLYRGWDTGLLDWRLQRRKRPGFTGL